MLASVARRSRRPQGLALAFLIGSGLIAATGLAQDPATLDEPAAPGNASAAAVAPAPGKLSPSHGAERPAADFLSLTAEAAVKLALGNSRQLQSLDTMVEIQDHRGRAAGWLDNPELRFRNLSARTVDGDFDELEIGIRWRPPTLGAAAEERQQDQVQLWERRVEAERAREWLASRVRRACADVVLYRELVRLASDRVDNEVRRIAQIKTMMDLGRRSIVYYTNAKTIVSDAKNEQTRHVQALRDEERRLQRLTAVDARIEVVLEPLPAVEATQEQLLAIAHAHRPEVQLVEARQLLAVRRHQRERRRVQPWLSVVEVSRHWERGADDRNELMFGVEIPLFGRSDGRIQAARLGIARKEAQSLALRERIEDEVYDTFAAYTEARLAWQLARDDGGELIAEASRVIAEATAHGTVPADEVLELERAILDTEVVLAERRRELAHTVYFLYYALGIEGPDQALPTSSP